jgi:hypothetical protein
MVQWGGCLTACTLLLTPHNHIHRRYCAAAAFTSIEGETQKPQLEFVYSLILLWLSAKYIPKTVGICASLNFALLCSALRQERSYLRVLPIINDGHLTSFLSCAGSERWDY